MARAKAKINNVPDEVTLVLTWEEFKAVAAILGTIAPSEVADRSKRLLDSCERYGDLLRPRSEVEVTGPLVPPLHSVWRAIRGIYLGGGYDG